MGLEIPDEYIKVSAYRDSKAAGQATEELLKLKNPPTCILYPDDFSCFGGINMIKENGLRITEDSSVAGYDGIRIGSHIEPQLTTLKQNTKELGIKAGEKLISLIEHPKTTLIEQIVISGTVYEGKTVSRIEK